tara:strand:+ start:182 stop:289 length:108 start_codon:yes stop_codon:yes gene_type:complete
MRERSEQGQGSVPVVNDATAAGAAKIKLQSLWIDK